MLGGLAAKLFLEIMFSLRAAEEVKVTMVAGIIPRILQGRPSQLILMVAILREMGIFKEQVLQSDNHIYKEGRTVIQCWMEQVEAHKAALANITNNVLMDVVAFPPFRGAQGMQEQGMEREEVGVISSQAVMRGRRDLFLL